MIVQRIVHRLERSGRTPMEAADLVVRWAAVLIAAVQIPVTILGTVGLLELLR